MNLPPIPPFVLGIDVGFGYWGAAAWAWFVNGDLADHEIIHLSERGIPADFRRQQVARLMAQVLDEKLAEAGVPFPVAIETPRVDNKARGAEAHRKAQNTLELAALYALIAQEAAGRGCPVRGVTPGEGLSALKRRAGLPRLTHRPREVTNAFFEAFGHHLLCSEDHVARAAGVALHVLDPGTRLVEGARAGAAMPQTIAALRR